MSRLLRGAISGALAGAAGTTALNAVTYLDMVIRARPASETPEKAVEAFSSKTGVAVPGDDKSRSNRIAGLGPLTGLAAGVGAGMAIGAIRGAGWQPGLIGSTLAATSVALIAGNAPMTVLGVTNPRRWPAKDWAADLIPHLAYGAVAAAAFVQLD